MSPFSFYVWVRFMEGVILVFNCTWLSTSTGAKYTLVYYIIELKARPI